MLRAMSKYFSTISPVFLDGSLYFVIALVSACLAILGSEEAVKFVNPILLFWLKFTLGGINAGFLALKMFRSTAYSEHLKDKKIKEDQTSFFQNTNNQPKEDNK
jgi:hypothetical protein